MSGDRLWRAVVGVGVAAGIVARVLRYLDARSLWNDEAQLALNIWGRDALGLLAPLEHAQSAPWGFLLLERGALVLLGPGELALRAVPLVASLAAIPLFARVARRVLPGPDAGLALLLFATCEPLVFYASELKPYALDVLVAIGLVDLALRLPSGRLGPRDLAALAVSGALALWLSYPAAFVCAALGAGLVARCARTGSPSPGALAGVAAVWGASLAGLLGLQLGPALSHPYLRDFWTGGFAPMPPRSLADWLWYPRTLAGFFVDPVGISPWWLGLALGVAGAVRLAKQRPRAAWWLVGPLLFGLLASMLALYPLRTWPPIDPGARLYPFAGRLWLYAVPAALLLVAAGAGAAIAWTGARAPWARLAAVLAIAAGPGRILVANAWSPPRVQELRPLAHQLAAEVDPEDFFWVQQGSEPTFEYYARLLRLPVRAHNVGLDAPERAAALEAELAALAPGDRVWLVALDHPAWTTGPERRAIEERLGQRARAFRRLEAPGARVIGFAVPGPAAGAPAQGAATRSSSSGPTR